MVKCTIIYILALSLIGFASCITKVDVPIRLTTAKLVVEGSINTDAYPYKVKLSYSSKFSNIYQPNVDSLKTYVSDALVLIKNNHGDSTLLTWVTDGTYETTDSNFLGTVGLSYTLVIHLSNGKTYISKPETISPVPPIDSISLQYDSSYIGGVRPTQIAVSTNTHDPSGVKNFYRWSAYGYLPRKSWGEPCVPFAPPCTDPYSCTCYALCEQLHRDNEVRILSDQYIDGQSINQTVYYSPVYWFGIHYVEIKQSSISLGAYIFWLQYLDQTNRTGSILDPLPSSLIGNIYNAADSTDFALGYFEASDVFTKKISIVPYFLQTYNLKALAGEYIEQGDCHFAYPNSLEDNAPPDGWDNAQRIEMH